MTRKKSKLFSRLDLLLLLAKDFMGLEVVLVEVLVEVLEEMLEEMLVEMLEVVLEEVEVVHPRS